MQSLVKYSVTSGEILHSAIAPFRMTNLTARSIIQTIYVSRQASTLLVHRFSLWIRC